MCGNCLPVSTGTATLPALTEYHTMTPFRPALAAIGLSLLTACVAPTGPVEVTRFHVPEIARITQGTIAVEPAAGQDGSSLEYRTYAAAVARELNRIGYSELVAGGSRSTQVAVLNIQRATLQPDRAGNPVSVGVGGATGGYGAGVGLGVGINLSGPPPSMIDTRMSVTIRDRASGQTLWEGRASFSAKSTSPLAQTQLGASRMAEALFRDFPGQSGETILVK